MKLDSAALRRRAACWLLASVMFYACGPGHLLHPLLHEHLAAGHHRASRPAAGERTLVPHLPGPPHHCAFCEFLAHFAADQPIPTAGVGAAPAPEMLRRCVRPGLISVYSLGLPGSRSPPIPSAII